MDFRLVLSILEEGTGCRRGVIMGERGRGYVPCSSWGGGQ